MSQVHDFPDEATFLSDEDRRRVIRRLKLDNQSSAEHEEFKLAYLWAALKDWKTYTGMIVSSFYTSKPSHFALTILIVWRTGCESCKFSSGFSDPSDRIAGLHGLRWLPVRFLAFPAYYRQRNGLQVNPCTTS